MVHLCKVQAQAKLIYGVRSQNIDFLVPGHNSDGEKAQEASGCW